MPKRLVAVGRLLHTAEPMRTPCAAPENAAPERALSGAQRPETVQVRSLSPGLGGEFRVMARIPGLQIGIEPSTSRANA
jgi:hypothetical protein